MQGWIKLHRKFCEWEWFNISEMVHLFIYLLLNANHEDGSWRGIAIKRGQILTGLNSLHERTGISIQSLRTCLDRLQSTKEINRQVTNKYSIITICNYETYQDVERLFDNPPNKQVTSNQQATNKQVTTNKNKKEELIITKNEKKEAVDAVSFAKNFNHILYFKWQEWVDFRKIMKKPYKTTKGAAAAYNRLTEIANSDSETAVAIIKQSIEREWLDFYPLKQNKSPAGVYEDPVQKNIQRIAEAERQMKLNKQRNGNTNSSLSTEHQ